MTRILTTIHLSDIQKEVLAKVFASPTPHVAWSELLDVSSEIESNVSSARDTLGNLGLLYVGDGELKVTDRGREVMREENLIDEIGELTEDGQRYASIDRQAPKSPSQGLPMESLQLIRSIHDQATLSHQQKLLEAMVPVTEPIIRDILDQASRFFRGQTDDISPTLQYALQLAFEPHAPYGVITGDEGTIDEWLMDTFVHDERSMQHALDIIKDHMIRLMNRGAKVLV
jgi:hypothetical protein